MSCGFRPIPRRSVCLLAALGLLAATAPGCGGEGPKANAPTKKEDNSEMQDFMKSQQKQQKRK